MSSRIFGRFGPLIGAIDEGTSSARFLVFAASTAEVLTYHQVEILQHCPREGWVEQDPMEILNAVNECIAKSFENLKKLEINPNDIVATGITNQRESTVVWDCYTGKPLNNVVLWLDVRNTNTVDEVLNKIKDQNQNYLKPLCGLPISTYFSALKVKWLIDNVPEVKRAVDDKRCFFGTVDTWLIWNLTGGKNGGLHITDVTNASRTMLMNISTLHWDSTLCKFFDIPMHILPEIRSSSEIYGFLVDGPLEGVPISGCLGDQQSALVGQMCFKQGQAKNTYGTGCFLLYNTGTAKVLSDHGLLTTVAYRMGKTAPVIYALEGSVAVAGVAMKWLRDNLGIIKDVSDSEEIVKGLSAKSPGEVCFVPAFSGLYAPYWRKDARSIICGLTEDTSKELLVKATMEAVCFQTRDILEAMNKDCGISLTKLLVDGGMTSNSYMMQMQADLCGIPVVRPLMAEATALGAAIAAGSAEGIGVWNLNAIQSVPSDIFTPSISEDIRDMRYSRWKMAIARSLNWEPEAIKKKDSGLSDQNIYKLPTSVNLFPCGRDKEKSIYSSIPAGLFLLSSFGLIILARKLQSS